MSLPNNSSPWAIGFVLLLSACTTAPDKTRSITSVQNHLAKSHPAINFASLDAGSLVAQPLTPQAAVQLMLIKSPRIQAQLSRLGEADATKWQAALINNPRLSFALLKNNGTWLWDFGLSQTLAQWLTRDKRRTQAELEATSAELTISRELQLAISDLQQAYFSALAAQQQLAIHAHLNEVAQAKFALAQSLLDAGNISRLNYLAFTSEVQLQERALHRQQTEVKTRLADLAYWLGVKPEQFSLPTTLPHIQTNHFASDQLIAEALNNRLDLQQITQQQVILNAQKNLVRKENGIADSSIGVAARRESDGTTGKGGELELAIPIFDRGQAKLAALDAQISGANAELEDTKQKIEKEVQQPLAELLEAEIQYQLIENQSRTANERIQLAQREVNFMLASPFELLDLKARAVELQLEQNSTLLDYWHARSQLEAALGKALDIDVAIEQSTQENAEQKNADEHQHHHMHSGEKP